MVLIERHISSSYHSEKIIEKEIRKNTKTAIIFQRTVVVDVLGLHEREYASKTIKNQK